MKPLIGVLSRKLTCENFENACVHQEYLDAIIASGGIPIIIVCKDFSILELCDGILIPGGDEITELDNYVYDYLLESKKPFLGICLGMQLMVGESFLQDVSEHYSKTLQAHEIKVFSNTLLSTILPSTCIVNSRHHQKVFSSSFYTVAAQSKDGVIEALEISSYPFHIGVQWHPETMYFQDENMRNLFQKFIQSCKKS